MYESNVYPEGHVETLRARIHALERQLQSLREHQPLGQQPPSGDISLRADADADHGTPQQSRQNPPGRSSERRMHDEADTAFDMLSPDPAYLGISSGFALARTVQAAIGHSVPRDHRIHARSRTDLPEERPRSSTGSPESRQVLAQFLQAYLSKVHSKHLFLSPKRLLHLHNMGEALRRAARPPANKSIVARCEFFLLQMIYAIGARYLQLSQEQYRGSSDTHYMTAVEDIGCLFETRALEAVEGMLLLAIFQLRSPSRPGIWSIIGIAMGHAVSVGLHRRFHGTSRVTDERRKHIFWTIYLLDRTMARTLGRPFCISDRDIDVDLPSNVSADIDDEEEMAAALQNDPGATPMSAALHILRLARIESKIYFTLHRVDRPLSDLASDKVARLRQLLDAWKDEIPTTVPNAQDEDDTPNYYVKQSYHVLQYHKAMLLILLPGLSRLSVADGDFRLCIASAGQVGQLYKRLHDYQSSLSYSLVALHATFVAGLTLIYCFLVDRTVFDLQFSSDVRACSTVLYIISERWTAARKVRNAFEHMINNTIEKASFHTPKQPFAQSPAQAPGSFAAGPSTAFATSQQNPDVIWSELVALIQTDSTNNGAAGDSSAARNDPEDLWSSLGSWFGESEDFWLGDESTSYHGPANFPIV